MENKVPIAIPAEYQKNYQRVLELISEVDLIIEVADARIIHAETNLLDYSQPELKAKERMIILTHTDLADQKQTDKWIKYFKLQNINCEILQIDEQISNETAAGFWKKYGKKLIILQNKKVAVIGLPNSGKTTLIKKFLADTTILENVSEQDNLKIDISKHLAGTQIIDTPPILGVNYLNTENYWHLQMVNAVNISENSALTSVKLFSLLLKKYRQKLETVYSLKLPTTVNPNEILNLFLKVFAHHKTKVAIQDITDFDLIAKTFWKDVYQLHKITNFSLEWVSDY